MINAELIRQARLLALQTKRACVSMQQGDFQRTHQGTGFEFDQLAEYHHECDTRFIDWKSSARVQKLLVRQFKDERQRKILLAVDTSSSLVFGSHKFLKGDIQRQIAAVLAYASYFSHDAVGCIWFDQEVHTIRAPRAHKNHIMNIIYRLLEQPIEIGKKTNFNEMFKQLLLLNESRLIVIAISDFIGEYDVRLLSMVAKKHKVYALRIMDVIEKKLPSPLPFILEDVETGALLEEEALFEMPVLNSYLEQHYKEQDALFKKMGIRCATLINNEHFIQDTIKFFKGLR